MKPIAEMTRQELGAFIASALRRANIDVVLSGGSCVSIYSNEQYVSMDLDFVNARFAKRAAIREAMEQIGFTEDRRYFRHPDTEFFVEFPPGPLGVGEEPVAQIDELSTDVGVLRIISATDCVKDRLTWYYHDADTECLEQAILVAQHQSIDIEEVERWSKNEGKLTDFNTFRNELNSA